MRVSSPYSHFTRFSSCGCCSPQIHNCKATEQTPTLPPPSLSATAKKTQETSLDFEASSKRKKLNLIDNIISQTTKLEHRLFSDVDSNCTRELRPTIIVKQLLVGIQDLLDTPKRATPA
ncbi:hypothetical protein L6452_19314 [Arctium lappa]|uniref:Uncharacterized protein n=1 Tax=Arctium lappa TaxID=4217 RepID=A0ACB9BA28_ARCLA|nr:hypothetical protein L6452_19314 [Arctium lappa]